MAGEERVDLVLLGDDVADVCGRVARRYQDVQILNKRIRKGLRKSLPDKDIPSVLEVVLDEPHPSIP